MYRAYTHAFAGTVATFLVRSGARIEVAQFLTYKALERARMDIVVKERELADSERLASISRLAIGMAHKVNNPLTIVTGALHIVLKRTDPSNKIVSQVARAALDAGQRIANVISNTIEFSVIQSQTSSGTAVDHSESASLHQVLTQDFLSSVAKSRPIELRWQSDALRLQSVVGSDVRIKKAIAEVLRNAAVAIEGDPNGWIRITVQSEGSYTVLAIENSGPKIPRELRERIFEPFFSTYSVGDGLGIGLVVARGVAESYGGNLTLLDDLQKTCFEMRLLKSAERHQLAV